MNYARIVDGAVAEIISWSPTGRYPEDWVWVDCPADTQQGATYDGTDFTNPVVPDPVDPDPVEPEYKPLTFVEFVTLVRKAGQMTDEKAVEVLDTSTDASIVLLRKMLEMGGDAIHRDNVVVQDGLQTLVDKSFITGDGKDAILAAWPQL